MSDQVCVCLRLDLRYLAMPTAGFVMSGGESMTAPTRPADLTTEELHAVLARLAVERRGAEPGRRHHIRRVCDNVLDELLVRGV